MSPDLRIRAVKRLVEDANEFSEQYQHRAKAGKSPRAVAVEMSEWIRLSLESGGGSLIFTKAESEQIAAALSAGEFDGELAAILGYT